MTGIEAPSVIPKLLSDISWEGSLVSKRYRDGGRGKENVLTAEVFLALEYLPREPFCTAISQAVLSEGKTGIFLEQGELEGAKFSVFPNGRFELRSSAANHQQALDVQIDAMIETEQSIVFVEAKKIGGGSFQEEQLARTYLIALREAGERRARLLIIPGLEPPVRVKNIGKVGIKTGILASIESVYAKIEGLDVSLEDAKERIDESVFWITWPKISDAIDNAKKNYRNSDESTRLAVFRIANSLIDTVSWHGSG